METQAPHPTMTRLAAALVLGVVLGLVGARILFVNSALSLIPWGCAAALVGAFSPTRRAAMLAGGVFGFGLLTSFMFFGYAGDDPVATKTLPFAALGVAGAACALIPAFIGQMIVRCQVRRRRKPRGARR